MNTKATDTAKSFGLMAGALISACVLTAGAAFAVGGDDRDGMTSPEIIVGNANGALGMSMIQAAAWGGNVGVDALSHSNDPASKNLVADAPRTRPALGDDSI